MPFRNSPKLTNSIDNEWVRGCTMCIQSWISDTVKLAVILYLIIIENIKRCRMLFSSAIENDSAVPWEVSNFQLTTFHIYYYWCALLTIIGIMLSANAVVWRSSNVLFCFFFFFKVLSFFQSFFLYSNFLGSVPKRNETVDSQCGCVSAMFKVFARVVPLFSIVMRGEFSSSLPHPFFVCASVFFNPFFFWFLFLQRRFCPEKNKHETVDI